MLRDLAAIGTVAWQRIVAAIENPSCYASAVQKVTALVTRTFITAMIVTMAL
jgi:hypothetical protein